jgi:VWFA-related protein
MSRVALAIAVIIVALATAHVPAQSARPLVTFNAVVSSAAGDPVPLLTRDDFEVAIDDVKHPIETFVERNRPVVGLLVDVSASMFTIPGTLEEALECLVDGIAAGDRLRVGAVARHLFLGPVRSDYKALRTDVVKALTPDVDNVVGPSPLWDAIAFVADELKKEPDPRAIILFTDGRSTGNRIGLRQAAEVAVQANVAVNVVVPGPPEHLTVMPQDGERAVIVRPSAPLSSLAEVTGGTLIRLSAMLPPDAFTRVFAELRDTYTLGVRPQGPQEARLHRVAVRLRRPGFHVRTRIGYLNAPIVTTR